MNITPFDLAMRFVGIKEVAGALDNPSIIAMLRLDATWPEHDEVPWCSAFVNYIAWLLRLPRSKSLLALSWLDVGTPVEIKDAQVDSDVVVLSRTGGGHVAFFAGMQGFLSSGSPNVYLLGANQGDKVGLDYFPISRIIGVRRLGS